MDKYNESSTLSVAATSATYAAANTVTWETRTLGNKTITVVNGGSESATLRIRGRASIAGEWVTLQEGTLNAGTGTIVYLNNWYYDTEIAVKDDSGHTAIEISYGGKH